MNSLSLSPHSLGLHYTLSLLPSSLLLLRSCRTALLFRVVFAFAVCFFLRDSPSASLMSASDAKHLTPDQELQILKLVLNLRKLGDVQASERLRGRVRRALLESPDDSDAQEKAEELIRRATRQQSKLDGSYEEARLKKRLRREQEAARAARYVDAEAETGDEDEEPASGEEDAEEEAYVDAEE